MLTCLVVKYSEHVISLIYNGIVHKELRKPMGAEFYDTKQYLLVIECVEYCWAFSVRLLIHGSTNIDHLFLFNYDFVIKAKGLKLYSLTYFQTLNNYNSSVNILNRIGSYNIYSFWAVIIKIP